MYTLICVVCKKTFLSRYTRRKLCSPDCKGERRRQQWRRYKRQAKQRQGGGI